MTSDNDVTDLLKRFDDLPDSANVTVAVAAAHDQVSERNVRRTYPTVLLSPGRRGVNVGWLRSRGKSAA
jgi:hypothetical protein